MISLIFAVAANNVIGKDNKLPWHLPEDMKWFKEKTKGKPVIMGFNTWLSIIVQIGKSLPDRTNFVLTSKSTSEIIEILKKATREKFPELDLEKILAPVIFCRRIGESIQRAEAMCPEEVFVIGGVRVFNEVIKDAEKLYVTEIHRDFEGDTYFPDYNKDNWELCPNSEENKVRDHEGIKYSFNIYRRARVATAVS